MGLVKIANRVITLNLTLAKLGFFVDVANAKLGTPLL